MDNPMVDLIVLGAGIAGLSAAREGARAGMSVLCIEALMFGGLVVNINELDPAPAGASGSGVDLASELMGEIVDLGVEYLSAQALAVECRADAILVRTSEGERLGRALILASGARHRELEVPGAAEFEQRGVSYCADCDAPLHQDGEVVVVGGGDSALQEALVLARFCRSVHLVCRDETFSARPGFVAALRDRPAIRVRMRTRVNALLGTDALESVLLRQAGADADEAVPCSAVFVCVGLRPQLPPIVPMPRLDGQGAVCLGADGTTSVPGLFAAGAVRAEFGGLLDDAMADARVAVQGVRAYLGRRGTEPMAH